MKTTKRWIIAFISLSLVCVIAMGACMYLLDPLLQYGTEGSLIKYYKYEEMYSNPGIARNYTYDSVLVGTSMIENTDVDECDKLLGTNMVRLPYSGGTSYNMKTILDVCFASDNQIDSVYWALDEYQLLGSSDETRFPLPEYLYRHDNAPSLSYLLNFDIFYRYAFIDTLETLRGEESTAERRGEYWTANFSKETTLNSYKRDAIATEKTTFADIKEQVDKNLDQNILPLIQQNPDTEFTFFMPPYSVLYWDRSLRTGSFDGEMDAVEYSMKKLLEYENVQIFFFQNEQDIILDLDNYKDYTHYAPWVNSFMTQSLASGYRRVLPDQVETVIDDMRTFVHNCDFDTIFE